MAPYITYTNTYGTVGGFTVAANERPGGVLEDNQVGYVVAVSITPTNGTPVEVSVQPAHPDGFRATTLVGNALVKALHVVTGA